jgi:hypothetical protein
MEETANIEAPRKARGRGCLIACLVIIVLAVNTVWQIQAPGRHARHVREAIQKGMTLEQVENLLAAGNDRHLVWFEILTDGKWKRVERDQFVRFAFIRDASTSTNNATTQARVELVFLGMAPNRVAFLVEFDSSGRVSRVSDTYGWD